MVVVDGLQERLDARTSADFLLSHGAGDLQGVAVNSGNNGMTVLAGIGSSVIVVDDDSLATGVSAVQNNDDLSRLQTRWIANLMLANR